VIPGFIAEMGDDIPGLLLVFHTNYFLTDLLVSSRADAVVWYEMPGWEYTGCSWVLFISYINEEAAHIVVE
jgi:hypothetical protein